MGPRQAFRWFLSDAALAFCSRVVLLLGALTAISLTGPFKAWVEEPLISFVTWTTDGLLALFGAETSRWGSVIHSKGFNIEIVSGCTGIFTFTLLLSAIVCFPAAWRARLRGLLGGALFILALNQVRIITLFFIGKSYPELFSEMHVFVWQGVIIVAVAFYFYWWVSRSLARREPAEA